MPSSADAQVIRGRASLPDGDPIPGIVIAATNPRGVEVARALSNSAGDFVLRLPNGGTFEIRALRIGFRPTIVRDVTVAARDTIERNIVLTALPVAIAGMQVRDRDECSLKGRGAETSLQLWEQARAALTAAQLSEQSGRLDVRLIRVDGHIDAPNDFGEPLFPAVDTARAREMIVDRVFAMTSVDTIAARGYVRSQPDGRTMYDMPNAETLLSDAFVGGHCFSIRSSNEHREWIGLGFTPRRAVDGVADIRGVLWLDRATAELRRVEFEFDNLPPAEYRVCDDRPFIPMTPERIKESPPFEQPQPNCSTVRNDRSNRLRLGGRADFVRLPTGEWLVAEWLSRTGPDSARYRPFPWRVRTVKGKSERCYTGSDCRTIIGMRSRLVTSIGIITTVVRDGVRLYHNDSASILIAAMSARQAGDRPAGVIGTITNAEGRPLIGAVLQTEDPWRAVYTDSAGAFELRPLPPGMIRVSIRCRGYEVARAPLPLLPDSTRRLRVALVRDDSTAHSAIC
jgi:hypothetical protein